jgi:YfiH family protein
VEPVVSADFEWRQTPAGRVIVASAVEAIAPHFFSSRDFSPPGARFVDHAAVASVFGVDAADVVSVRQVHGRSVAIVEPGRVPGADSEADAIVSTDPDRVILVRVADCVPILLADAKRRAVAAVHAGWRGTAAGVVLTAVDALDAHGVPPVDIVAGIGPCVGACCYEVDDAVRDAFERQHGPESAAWFGRSDRPGRYRLDLARANRDQLLTCGVPALNVHDASACTFDDASAWHSHRREGEAAGRMVAAIRLVGPPL